MTSDFLYTVKKLFDLDQLLSDCRAEIEQKTTVYNNKKEINELDIYLTS
jgi:hypothetical protein